MGKQRNAYDDKCTREGCWGYCQTLTEEARRRRSREARMTVVPLMTTSGTLCKTRLGMEEIIKSLSSSVARHSHLSLKRKKKGKKKNLSNFLRRGTLPSAGTRYFFLPWSPRIETLQIHRANVHLRRDCPLHRAESLHPHSSY